MSLQFVMYAAISVGTAAGAAGSSPGATPLRLNVAAPEHRYHEVPRTTEASDGVIVYDQSVDVPALHHAIRARVQAIIGALPPIDPMKDREMREYFCKLASTGVRRRLVPRPHVP